MLGAIDPTGALPDAGQRAAVAMIATLAGGGLAGLLGQNAMAGSTAAQNEALNNTLEHPEDLVNGRNLIPLEGGNGGAGIGGPTGGAAEIAPEAVATGGSGATSPVGVSGSPMTVPRGTNAPTTINGIDYSGHAIDQMQGRGVPPSVVQNTIENGQPFPTRMGTAGYYDPVNNVRVITNSNTGRVVTVIPGAAGK